MPARRCPSVTGRSSRPVSAAMSSTACTREVMKVHPLTLLTLAYAGDSMRKADQLLTQVRQELEAVLKERNTP